MTNVDPQKLATEARRLVGRTLSQLSARRLVAYVSPAVLSHLLEQIEWRRSVEIPDLFSTIAPWETSHSLP